MKQDKSKLKSRKKRIKSVQYASELARVKSKQVSEATSQDVSIGQQERKQSGTPRQGYRYSDGTGTVKARLASPIVASQEAPLILQVEGPFQVKNRLMNLMGSNKVRLTDGEYIKTLYQRIVAGENDNFNKRKTKRELDENHREFKLIIDGKLEAREDQVHLNKNPVIRVNRTIRRLDKINEKFFETQQVVSGEKLPKITPVEPFEYDQSGNGFKAYKNHRIHRKSMWAGVKKDGNNPNLMMSEEHSDKDEKMEADFVEREDTKTNEETEEIEVEIESIEDLTFGSGEDRERSKESIQSIPKDRSISAYLVQEPQEPKEPQAPQEETNFCKVLNGSDCSLYNPDAYSTLSMQNLVRDLTFSIASNEQAQRALVQSKKHRDSVIAYLDKDDINNAEMFQYASKISKLNRRKQRAADDKLRKFEVATYNYNSRKSVH